MKKIIKLVMSFLLIMSIVGCANKKTTVDSQEEWEKVIDPKNYYNATVNVVLTDEGSDLCIKSTYSNNGNVIKIVDDMSGTSSTNYYVNDENSLTLKSFYDEGENVYTTYLYEYETLDELQKDWNETLDSMFGPNKDGFDTLADGTYDEEKKCYHFDFTLYDVYEGEVEVYVENGKVVKEIENVVFDDDYKMRSEYTYDFTNKQEIKTPESKNSVLNEEEWKSLFDVNKYANCSVDYYRDDMEIYSEITKDEIIQTVYLDDMDEYVVRTIKRVDETKESVIEEESNGNKQEYDIEYDEILTCFEDNFKALTYDKDLSDMFNEVSFVTDHYEYNFKGAGTNALIKLYISNGYIISVEANYSYADSTGYESTTYIGDFNRTVLE